MNIDFKSELHQKYTEYTELYENYENVWSDLRKLVGNKFDQSYISLPLPRTIVQTYSNLAFGNNISVSIKSNPEANEAINDWIEREDFNMILSESSISQAIKGGIVFLNYLDNGMSRIKYIEPDYYFPKVSPIDKRKVLSETIAIPFTEGKKQYLHTETYEKGENGNYHVTTQVFNYTNNKQGKPVDEPEIVDTGLEQSPITYIPFSRSGNSFYGDSIFAGLLNLFDVLNYRISQINEVLSVHADPNVVVDSRLLDEDGNLNLKGSRTFEFDGENDSSGESPIRYVTWDGQLTANFKYINEILLEIMKYASPFLNPALNGMDKASQASGKAIKLKSHNTQAMVERSYQYWRRGIKKILLTAQQLQVYSGEKSYIPTPVKVELSQNLPDHQLEMAQTEQLKVQSGLSSQKSAIARLNPNMTSQQVEEEYLEILNEQSQANQQTFQTDMLGFDNSFNDDNTSETDHNVDDDPENGDLDESE